MGRWGDGGDGGCGREEEREGWRREGRGERGWERMCVSFEMCVNTYVCVDIHICACISYICVCRCKSYLCVCRSTCSSSNFCSVCANLTCVGALTSRMIV